MILNHTRKFVFVHVPKSGGTSISQLLSPYTSYRDLELGGTALGETLQREYRKRFGLHKHSTAQEIRAVVGDEVWSGYRTFGTIRSPYSRACSAFHFIRRWRANSGAPALAFIDRIPDFRSFALTPGFKRLHPLLQSQTRWLCAEDGTPIVDTIARVESFNADFPEVLRGIVGLPDTSAALIPEKLNVSAADGQTLDKLLVDEPEVERAVYEAYRDDFEVFGFPRWTPGGRQNAPSRREPETADVTLV